MEAVKTNGIQRSRLCAVGELTNCPPGTEAKFITKSRSLELLPGRITSAEYKAWICTADDCFKVLPPIAQNLLLAAVLLSYRGWIKCTPKIQSQGKIWFRCICIHYKFFSIFFPICLSKWNRKCKIQSNVV